MTEKRFKKISVCGDWGIKDVQNDNVLFFATTDEVNDTLKVLNELYDENDVLKQQLKTKYIVNKQYEELQKVKEENEQLKDALNQRTDQCDKYYKENEQLKIRFKEERDTAMKLGSECDSLTIKNQKLKQENEQLKQVLGSILIEVKQEISASHKTGEIRAFINPNSFDLISDVLRKYGALKEWYE